ncbi:MAG TPA: hypothetical protein VHH88_04680 [Verrucomicrobiae bacterium]|nr:hypothetical protein [Verrucomicrobiae bacterium]
MKGKILVGVLMAAGVARSAFGCAACYGRSDSALAKGMNWGIFTLLGVIVLVLGAIATVSFVLARRASACSARESAPASPVEVEAAPATSQI